jgi:hypothetical protein
VSDAATVLAEQCRLQVRILEGRVRWWFKAIFVAGFGFAALGLFSSFQWWRDSGKVTVGLIGFGIFFVLFGMGVARSLLPLRPKPRIVPYFLSELGPLGGDTITAFYRGRMIYLEIMALDALAKSLGVRPLSAFGFAYDHFGQAVHWHSANDGLATVNALRQAVSSPGVVQDLDALASVLRTAAGKDVPFSLVLRVFENDNLQGVCTRETRQGHFW